MEPATDTSEDPYFTDDGLSDSIAPETDSDALDIAFLQSSFTLAARDGWSRFSLVEAAKNAGLPLEVVRTHYPLKSMLLLRLGRLADESALRDDGAGTLREHLFDLLMRRLDVFQDYREGLRAVMHAVPYDPALGAILTGATLDSIRWVADAAGLDCTGLGGVWRINALGAVWGHALRAWEKDESPDLGSTMAALDTALNKAERFGVLKASARRKLEDATRSSGLPDHELELES
ncbi:TetR family transcriptional regulator [Gluconobacter wancherniae]|uniref:TetR family transcriptional regulator n=1 Tax=Gluconobacter wancherniae TaxID=1307955 RepID=UPI001B8DA5D4|nr:TetR family transcriptional regulator [Gluconobacter wancherniae]MBS1062943.1 TetR family transcriptional regulator [Gluconobacter wancherniae]MBS1095720.1 TetR family transcriptional regulator [Gluconobacter wancherniae]